MLQSGLWTEGLVICFCTFVMQESGPRVHVEALVQIGLHHSVVCVLIFFCLLFKNIHGRLIPHLTSYNPNQIAFLSDSFKGMTRVLIEILIIMNCYEGPLFFSSAHKRSYSGYVHLQEGLLIDFVGLQIWLLRLQKSIAFNWAVGEIFWCSFKVLGANATSAQMIMCTCTCLLVPLDVGSVQIQSEQPAYIIKPA